MWGKGTGEAALFERGQKKMESKKDERRTDTVTIITTTTMTTVITMIMIILIMVKRGVTPVEPLRYCFAHKATLCCAK